MFPNIYRLKKIRKYEKFEKFAERNFRGRRILKNFAELTFAEKAKKRETGRNWPRQFLTLKYTSQILWDVLIRGIANSDIQLELLGHINKNMPLEEVLQFVKAKEAGKRSASRLHDNNHHHHHHTNAIKS